MKVLQNSFISLVILIAVSCSLSNRKSLFSDAISIPARGNSWIADNYSLNDLMISDSGITGWTDTSAVIKTFFRTEKRGKVRIALRAKNEGGISKVRYELGSRSGVVKIKTQSFDTIDLGEFILENPGYASLNLKGIKKQGKIFAEISDIIIAPDTAVGRIWFVKDDFYWGRRGPSVHLRYEIPGDAGEIEWFYNEITIPQGNDVVGSYFMANGFTDGYFGIQVNSPRERRVLFSVWSPYKTDNPREIPGDYKIILLDKGDDVYAGEFGNEGSGGQSYMKYMWKAGVTYRFLLRGSPALNNSTDYTAWFFPPEQGEWRLIASFRRPKGSRYLGNLYSFLENFVPATGNIVRQGYFGNQWICNKNGVWTELTSAKFTADATARKESRLDYAGGTYDTLFFLKNCGFFSENTGMSNVFTRKPSGVPPAIDLKSLIQSN